LVDVLFDDSAFRHFDKLNDRGSMTEAQHKRPCLPIKVGKLAGWFED